VGFRTSQYFATAFRKHTGLTPQAHRRQACPQGASQREPSSRARAARA
jgi:AraC-like DNA-binding protein